MAVNTTLINESIDLLVLIIVGFGRIFGALGDMLQNSITAFVIIAVIVLILAIVGIFNGFLGDLFKNIVGMIKIGRK